MFQRQPQPQPQPATTDDRHPIGRFGWLDLLRLLLLVGLATLLIPAAGPLSRPAVAQSRSVEWTNFDVELDLRQDGSYHVAERQAIAFQGGPFRGAFREIPLGRIEDIGNIQVSEVVDGQTQPYDFVAPSSFDDQPGTYTYVTSGASLRVDWGFPQATDETRTFLVEYDVVGGLRVYPDNDPPYQQISWIAVDDDLTDVAPVRDASMRIRLPRPVDPNRTQIMPGDDPLDHTTDGQVWTWQASDLTAGESFEVGLRFDPLVNAAPPAWQERSDQQEVREVAAEDRANVVNLAAIVAGLLTLVAGGVGILGLWYTRGRDPHTGPVADFIPTPPDDLPPGAVGTLIDERANEQDIVATLVDLGHRGVVKIEERRSEGVFGFGGGRDFELTLLQDNPPVAPFEADLLHSLFGAKLKTGTATALSAVQGRFETAKPAIRDHLYAEVVRRGYFTRSPEETRSSWRNLGTIGASLVVLLGFVLAGSFASAGVWVWFPVIVLAGLFGVVALLSGALPRKTQAGAEAAAKWRAFRNYLSSIERYEKLDEARDIFDRYLPYAVAFGLERSWVEKFAGVHAATPAWYGGGGGGGGPVILTGGGWGGGGPMDPYPRRWRGRPGGGTVIFPGGGFGGAGGGGDRDGGGGGFDAPDLPDLQGTSDRAGRTLQSSSDSLFDMLNSAGRMFGGMGGGGRGGGWGGGGGCGGGGGFGGGGGSGGGGGGGGGFR